MRTNNFFLQEFGAVVGPPISSCRSLGPLSDQQFLLAEVLGHCRTNNFFLQEFWAIVGPTISSCRSFGPLSDGNTQIPFATISNPKRGAEHFEYTPNRQQGSTFPIRVLLDTANAHAFWGVSWQPSFIAYMVLCGF